jgi:hypothetical protein
MSIYDVLETPLVYRISQFVLAPGMDRIVTARLARMFAGILRPEKVLEVGCGPASWLWKLGVLYIEDSRSTVTEIDSEQKVVLVGA